MKAPLPLLVALLWCLGTAPSAHAQLAHGSDAPDFTVTDLNGVTHNLYSLLDQGYTVFLEFSATWCGPCWNYHSGGHLKELWNQYGPNGTDEVFVIFIEGDLNTNTACLYGPSGCVGGTQGNWVSGTPFPIVDLTPATIGVRYDYQIGYWPTIYSICPQTKKVYLAGQRTTDGQYEYVNSCGMTYVLDGVGDASCHDFNDGFVHISPDGGYAPFTYTWSNGSSSQNLNNVGAGDYSCTIKDKNHVTIATATYTVDEPPAIDLITDEIVTETCPGYEDGGVNITVSGGMGGFSYEWSNGQSGEDLQGVSGGAYSVITTDATGCTESQSYTVPVNPLPVANAGIDGVITCSEPQYTIDGTQSENFGVSWEWTTQNGNIVSGANTMTPVVDEPGDYHLTVTFFATGCFSTDDATITEDKTIPNTDAGPPGLVDCAQPQDTLDGSNSQGGNGFNYLWTTPDGNIVSGAATAKPVVDESGTYILSVTNQTTGCVGRDTTQVILGPENQVPVSAYTPAITNLIVQFDNASNGNATSYLWTFGDGQSSTEESPTHIYQQAGTYEVCLTATNACGEDTECTEITVETGAMAVVVVNVTPSTCNHGSDGGADIEVNGGQPDYSYAWSHGATTQDIADVPPGTYQLTVTDANNATAIITVTIGFQFLVNIDEVLTQQPDCHGFTNGTIALNTSSSGGSLDYSWSHDPELNNSIASGLGAGEYSVIISDANGCTDQTSITLGQPDVLEGNLSVDPAEPGKDNGSASLNPTGGVAPYEAEWSNGQQGLEVENLAPGDYSVLLTDANGCTWETTFRVEETVSTGTIPSLTGWTLSPNPSRGDVFLQVTFDRSERASVRILNVYGESVYQKDTQGTQIQEQLALGHLPAGTYMVEVRTAEGKAVRKLVIQ